jgi:hypothetical protein
MSDGILFDNIIVTHDKRVADDYAAKTWAVKFAAEEKHQAEEDAKRNPVRPLSREVALLLGLFVCVCVVFHVLLLCQIDASLRVGADPPQPKSGDSLVDQLMDAFRLIINYLRENPLVAVASGVALLIPIGIAILCSPPRPVRFSIHFILVVPSL